MQAQPEEIDAIDVNIQLWKSEHDDCSRSDDVYNTASADTRYAKSQPDSTNDDLIATEPTNQESLYDC